MRIDFGIIGDEKVSKKEEDKAQRERDHGWAPMRR